LVTIPKLFKSYSDVKYTGDPLRLLIRRIGKVQSLGTAHICILNCDITQTVRRNVTEFMVILSLWSSD
jgi:hypothetical protein